MRNVIGCNISKRVIIQKRTEIKEGEGNVHSVTRLDRRHMIDEICTGQNQKENQISEFIS